MEMFKKTQNGLISEVQSPAINAAHNFSLFLLLPRLLVHFPANQFLAITTAARLCDVCF